MMGYQHVTPRKSKTCDKCGKTINAGEDTYKQGSRFYHPTCAWDRRRHFDKLINQIAEREQSLSHPKPKVDYVEMMQKRHGEVNAGLITDAPRPIQLSDSVIEVRYDGFEPRFSRPSRIKYPKPVFNTSQILINHRDTKNTEMTQSSILLVILGAVSAPSASLQ